MFEGIYFEFPKLFFVLFFFIACEALCKMRLPSIYFPHTAQFFSESAGVSKWLLGLKWLGIIMLITALMSPVKDQQLEVEPNQGYDIALVLDASQSMEAPGFDPVDPTLSRFEVVKQIVESFIKQRTEDNLGLVVFGEYAFIASPLTYDQQILAKVVAQLHVGMAGKFTALYEAIGQAVNLMHESKAKSKIAIVLTDGHNTPGGKIPLESALQMAQKDQIRIYTIGIGGPNEFNAPLLQQIAQETGGQFFDAQNAQQLQGIYANIDALEKSEIQREQYSFKHYYYLYPLFIGFMSLMLYVYLRNRRGWAV